MPDQMYASWVSGNAVMPEGVGSSFLLAPTSYADSVGLRGHNGIAMFTLKKGTTNWFSYPIPTPVITHGKRVEFHQAITLFNFTGGATLERVEVFDGATSRLVRTPTLTGDFRDMGDKNRWAMPTNCEVHWGVTIALQVSCPKGVDAEVWFHGAGMDFLANLP